MTKPGDPGEDQNPLHSGGYVFLEVLSQDTEAADCAPRAPAFRHLQDGKVGNGAADCAAFLRRGWMACRIRTALEGCERSGARGLRAQDGRVATDASL